MRNSREHPKAIIERYDRAVARLDIDQQVDLLLHGVAIARERIECEARAQTLRALDCGGTVSAHWDRVAIEADGETAVSLRLERDVAG